MSAQLPQVDSTIDVVTPENIAFQYQLAGPFRRWPAFMIDVGVRLAVWLVGMLLMGFLGAFSGNPELGIIAALILWFVLEWFYGGVLETYWNGQTVGKRLLGLRVLRVDGQPINGLQAVMRNLLRAADMMPLIPTSAIFGEGQDTPFPLPTCLLGLLAPLGNRRFQRLGDLVCGTMVVVEDSDWILASTKLDDPQIRRWSAELPASLIVPRKMARSLAAYVERRRYLSPARRHEIARHLMVPFCERWNIPPETDPDLLMCALYHRTFVAQQEDPAEREVALAEGGG